MTKEEKIKEAYGDLWEKVKDNIDTDGFVQFKIISHGVTNKMHYEWDFDLDYLSVETSGYSPDIKWRPVSLSGIETNNGWTKIESEEDLPKHMIGCDFIVSGIGFCGYFVDGNFYEATGRLRKNVTHYQPFEKRKYPIY